MKNTRPSLIKSLSSFVFYASLIYLVSSIDGHSLPDINKYKIDKVAHFVEYLIFAFLAMRVVVTFSPRMGVLKSFFFTLIIVVIFSCSDEWYQFFIPHRTCSFHDLVFDFIGATTGMMIFTYRKEKRAESIKNARRYSYAYD